MHDLRRASDAQDCGEERNLQQTHGSQRDGVNDVTHDDSPINMCVSVRHSSVVSSVPSPAYVHCALDGDKAPRVPEKLPPPREMFRIAAKRLKARQKFLVYRPVRDACGSRVWFERSSRQRDKSLVAVPIAGPPGIGHLRTPGQARPTNGICRVGSSRECDLEHHPSSYKGEAWMPFHGPDQALVDSEAPLQPLAYGLLFLGHGYPTNGLHEGSAEAPDRVRHSKCARACRRRVRWRPDHRI